MRNRAFLHSVVAGAALLVAGRAEAEEASPLDEMIRTHLAERGASARMATEARLARRYAIDLTGAVPTLDDLRAVVGMSPGQMFDYFASRPPTEHSAGRRPYVWFQLLADADHFLFSNSSQFSQVGHIREFEAALARLYSEGKSYKDFARWAMRSQMFLNRFPSAADRANAAFFLFLGRDSLANEVASGAMWNAYRLKTPGIPASAAEQNPDYHVYVYDERRCTDGVVVCEARLWSQSGSRPDDVIEMIVGAPMFAEAVVDRYWHRLVGAPLPGLDFPEIRRMLTHGLVEHDFDVNWLIREIALSTAYTQEAMFR